MKINLIDKIKMVISIFSMNTKGESYDMTDKIVGLIIAGFILFSLFGSMYSAYISACNTAGMTSAHAVLLGLIVTMLILAFVLMIWRSAKSGGK
jgi:hypothetical protein